MEIEEKQEESLDEDDIQTIEDTADRLTDLAMALCYYNPGMAKTALALSLGNLCGHEKEEEPCLHHAFEIAEEQHDFVQEQSQEVKEEKPNN